MYQKQGHFDSIFTGRYLSTFDWSGYLPRERKISTFEKFKISRQKYSE